MLGEPPVERPQWAAPQRPFDVAEQDHALLVGGVGGGVDVGLVEHHRLAIAPVVALAIDVDVAAGVVRRLQPKMKAQRASVRVAVPHQPGARRQ